MILAMPKSAIFTRPFLSSRIFSGLMSRWTMPSSCANCSASQICGTICSASRGESLPARSNCRRFNPSTNSMMKRAGRRPGRTHGRRQCWDGSTSPARGPSRLKRSANPGSPRGLRRKNLQRDQPVQRRLAGLVDRAHAALADEGENFKLRKQPRHFLHAGRIERRGRPAWRFPPPRPACSRQAGQSPSSAPAGSGGSALRTFVWHVGPGSASFIHPLRSKSRKMLPE